MEPRGVGEDFFSSVLFVSSAQVRERESEGSGCKIPRASLPPLSCVSFFLPLPSESRGIGVLFFLFVACLFGLLKLERAEGCIFGGGRVERIFFFLACLLLAKENAESLYWELEC